MEKAFSCGKTGKWPEKRRTGKRANEIECPEKGKGKAPDPKSRARYREEGVDMPPGLVAPYQVRLLGGKLDGELTYLSADDDELIRRPTLYPAGRKRKKPAGETATQKAIAKKTTNKRATKKAAKK